MLQITFDVTSGVDKEANRCQRFEPWWLKDPDCDAIISETWGKFAFDGFPNSLSAGLKLCAKALHSWSSTIFGSIPKRVKATQTRLEHLRNGDRSEANLNCIRETEKEFRRLLVTEEYYWRQRSCAEWLRAGDLNTKFFHQKATNRRKKNLVKGLEDAEGRWAKKP